MSPVSRSLERTLHCAVPYALEGLLRRELAAADATLAQVRHEGLVHFDFSLPEPEQPPVGTRWTPATANFMYSLGPPLNDAFSGFGADRSGGIVVAAQRTAADAGTLWAATNLGRVFVSHNANNATPANVTFARVDSTDAAAPSKALAASPT